MENKLLLIDGNSILNRAFYGYPEFRNSQGLCLHGVYGFLNIMNKHIKAVNPTHIAVSFDLAIPTFRHGAYTEYKGTRGPSPDGLADNFIPLQKSLTYMGISWIAIPGFEGDDVLGSLAHRFHDEATIIILSGDKDTFQLINEQTSIRLPKTQNKENCILVYDLERFESEYGFTPSSFVDMKGLMGDSSDNIPGVKGIGPKTAQKLISKYGNIENAYAHAEEIKPAKYGELLKSQYEMAVFSKTLATIVTDIPISFSLEELKLHYIWTDEALSFLKALEIHEKVVK